MTEEKRLSDKSIKVLGLIADGHSYSQIVDGNTDISYLDIFQAAEEALRLNEQPADYHNRMAEIKTRHANAYAPWTAEADAELASMQRQGRSIEEMASHFQRQPSAIRSRLSKLVWDSSVDAE